jgi:hypothetical protein
MPTTSHADEEPNQNRTETRSEACVVVAGALPLGESIAQEMIIPLSARTSQDVGDYTETCESIAGSFSSSLNLCLGRGFANVHPGLLALWLVLSGRLVGDELLLDLVWVEEFGFLAVCFIDLVLVSRRWDSDEIVEGNTRAF